MFNNNTEDLYFFKNQGLNISHNNDMPKTFHHHGNGSPPYGPMPFNPFAKGKIIKGSVAAKSKNFSETFKVNEMMVIIFFNFFRKL